MIGQTLNNRYEISSRLGKGAMGTVYLATDTQSNREVALKIISSDLAIEPDMLERFKREGEALRQLKHPNIVGFIDAFQHDETYVIVMEHVSGGSLFDLLKKGVLPIEQARQIALDLCDALIRAHRLNIIHRDIKPENILIDADGTPKLADFGVARLSEGTRMTRSGMQVGTPYYMSPEAWKGEKLDGQTDIWSLGVVLFEMLSGKVPFEGDTGHAVMTKVFSTQAPDLRKLRADVPYPLGKIVGRMLTRDKKRRYQSIRQVGVDLESGEKLSSTSGSSFSFSRYSLTFIIGIAIVGVLFTAINFVPNITTLFPTQSAEETSIPTQTKINPTAIIDSISTKQPITSFECTDAIGCVTIAPNDPIHIAYALTISGSTASLGEDSLGAIEIAINDRNSELLGHTIELTGEDTLCNNDGGVAAGRKFSSDQTIVGIIGTSCSSEARGAMPFISEAGMVMISPSNTNPDLTDPNHVDHYDGYFRVAHNDIFQGRIAAEFVYNELGIRKVATIHDTSPYANALQGIFADTFRELGGEVTAQESINVGDTDMSSVLGKIALDTPELIYFPIFEPEGNFVAAQAKEISGLENVILMSADGLFADSFPETTGDAAVGMYLSGPYVDPNNASYKEFLQKWASQIGGNPPSIFHAHAYDATNILLNAIESVASVGTDGTVYIPRKGLRDYLYALTNYPGLTGNLTCDENGDCATGEALAIFQIINGSWPPSAIWQP